MGTFRVLDELPIGYDHRSDVYYLNYKFRTVVFIADDGNHAAGDLERYLRELDAMVADYRKRGARGVLIADTRFVMRPPSPQDRARLGAWLRANHALLQEVVVGSVFIIPSPLMRGALTALGWVGVLPPGTCVEATFELALTRAQTLLLAESLPLHQDLAGPDAEQRAFSPMLAAQPTALALK